MIMQTPYRRVGDIWQIDLQLDSLQQLSNTLDPAPFPWRDLDLDAERYIVSAASNLPPRDSLALVLWLPPHELAVADAGKLRQNIHYYFQWEYQSVRRALLNHLREARHAALLGFGFMIACMVVRNLLSPLDNFFAHTAAEGLLVIGWVALWRPVDMVLYQWWPMRRQLAMMRKLSTIEVSLCPRAQTGVVS